MEDNSAAARIARFRQGKPMSREEREKLNQSSGVKKMWYESDNGGGDDQQEVPRSLNVGPSRQPARPNSALRAIRQPTDYMSPVSSNSLFQNTKLGESQNVDDMIQNSIRQLERDMYEFDRKTNAKMNLGSFDPTRSIDLKRSFDDSPNFRFGGSNMRDSKEFDTQRSRSASPSLMRRSQQNNNRLSDSTGDFLRKYDIGNYSDAPRAGTAAGRNYTGNISPLRLSGDILRSSVETLGSTGFMGLMKANLKLDGKKEEQEKPKEEKSDAQIAEINKTLEEFLSGMREQHPPRNPYFPEGVDETISQITNKLHSQIMEFKTLFGDKHLQEDAEISAQQERDEKMREEGRNQLRERQLLELDLPASHPLEFMGVWDGQQQQPVMPHQGKLDYFPYPVPHQAGGTHVGAGGGNAGIAGGTQHTPAKVGGGGAAAGEEDDMSHLRLSDNSVGSPFPHYDSTILSPEPGAPTTGRGGAGDGSGDAPSTVEGFPVGNKDSSAGGEGHSTGDKKTTGAGADGSAADGSAAPTLLNAGLLSQHAAAHMSVLSRPVAGAGAGGVHPVGGRNFAQGVGLVQAAIDVEMSAADEVVSKMRALRMGIGHQMRGLDALHGSLNVPTSDYRRQAAGMPLYARPSGPPPPPSHSNPAAAAISARMLQQGRYPAGLAPIFNAPATSSPYPYHAVPAHLQHLIPQQYAQQQHWGLEDHYAAAEQERLLATEDTRVLFNPYPDLVHDNIYGVARGIGSALDVAMNSLHARLPVAVEEAAPPPPTVSPSLADATAHAATEVLLTAAESEKNVVPPPGAPPAPSKATPVLSSEKVEANKAAASLVHDVLQEATTHPHSTAAPAPPVPAPAPAPPSKPAREVLAEMDEVLGIDDLKSNYLARDLMLPTPSTNTFPTSAATAARPSVPSPSKPFLQAADAYLQSHYAPSAHDPRVQYDAARRAGQQQQGRNNTSPMVVRAPSDRELQIQYSNHRLSGHDPQAGSSYNTGASAPPAGLEFAISRTASPQRAAPSTLYEAFHRPAGNGIATDSSGSAFPTDPRRIVAQANAMPLRRPTEGAALEYLRSQKIGVLNTDSGRKYVNPFPQPQVPAFTPPAQNPYYTTSERPRTSPAVSNVDYRATAGNPLLPDRRRTSSPATSAGVARGVHLEHKSMHSVQVPSPTSVAVHERELYLNQMRRLRQNMLQAV